MPRLSVCLIYFSLGYLAIGFTFGALMLANEGLAFATGLDHLLPVHIEILVMGWLVQLALGVAYWILPRFAHGQPRGNEQLIWLSLIILNSGILLVGLSVVFNISWFAFLGRVFETFSVLGYLWVVWPRVRPSR